MTNVYKGYLAGCRVLCSLKRLILLFRDDALHERDIQFLSYHPITLEFSYLTRLCGFSSVITNRTYFRSIIIHFR